MAQFPPYPLPHAWIPPYQPGGIPPNNPYSFPPQAFTQPGVFVHGGVSGSVQPKSLLNEGLTRNKSAAIGAITLGSLNLSTHGLSWWKLPLAAALGGAAGLFIKNLADPSDEA